MVCRRENRALLSNRRIEKWRHRKARSPGHVSVADIAVICPLVTPTDLWSLPRTLCCSRSRPLTPHPRPFSRLCLTGRHQAGPLKGTCWVMPTAESGAEK